MYFFTLHEQTLKHLLSHVCIHFSIILVHFLFKFLKYIDKTFLLFLRIVCSVIIFFVLFKVPSPKQLGQETGENATLKCILTPLEENVFRVHYCNWSLSVSDSVMWQQIFLSTNTSQTDSFVIHQIPDVLLCCV